MGELALEDFQVIGCIGMQPSNARLVAAVLT